MATPTDFTAATVTCVVLDDDAPLTVEELARACAVEPDWIVERVEAGYLGSFGGGRRHTEWRFASAELVRTRRLVALERDMDANPELAALVADLMEEVQRLRQRLR